MIAGRGITRSERTDGETQVDPMPFFGIQTWVALPEDHEDRAASFEHVPKRNSSLYPEQRQTSPSDTGKCIWREGPGRDGFVRAAVIRLTKVLRDVRMAGM